MAGGNMAQQARAKRNPNNLIANIEVPGYGGGFVRASSGNFIRITDIMGGQIGDLYAIAIENHEEFTSPSVTRLYNLTKFPRIGQSFYSNRERPLLTFIEDHSPGLHDMLMASCSRPFFESFGMEEHPNCHDNYFTVAAEAGIGHKMKPDPVNIFQNTPVMHDGSILAGITMTRPGDYVVLRAEADIILILTACSTEAINLCKSSPLRIEVFRRMPK